MQDRIAEIADRHLEERALSDARVFSTWHTEDDGWMLAQIKMLEISLSLSLQKKRIKSCVCVCVSVLVSLSYGRQRKTMQGPFEFRNPDRPDLVRASKV